MVNFRVIATSALALFAVPALSAITPAQMVTNIRTLTTKSQALQSPAQQITIISGPLIIIGQGPFPVSPFTSATLFVPLTSTTANHSRV